MHYDCTDVLKFVYFGTLPLEPIAASRSILVPIACLLRYFRTTRGFAHDDGVYAEHGRRGLGRELDRPLLGSEGVQDLMLRRRQRSVLFRLGEVK